MAQGYCKKCAGRRSFDFVDEKFGLKKWKCLACGNIQIGGVLGE